MTLDPITISNLTLVGTAFAAAFIIALWFSLILWTYRDCRQRARDPLARILAALVVTLLFLPGILIYLVLRPKQTIEEEYQNTLEEEALLQTIEDNPACPGCGRHVKEDWMVCPNCQTILKKPCHKCGCLLELPWNICPYCAAPVPGMRRENLSMEDALRSLPAENKE